MRMNQFQIPNIWKLGYLCDPPPLVGRGAGAPQLLGQQVGGRGLHQLSQHLLHDAERPVPTGHVQAQAHCLQRWADVAVVELTGPRYCWSSRQLLLLRVLGLQKEVKEDSVEVISFARKKRGKICGN